MKIMQEFFMYLNCGLQFELWIAINDTCKQVDVDIDGDNSNNVFEMWIGMNEFSHCILEMHHRGQGLNPHSGLCRCCLNSAKMP